MSGSSRFLPPHGFTLIEIVMVLVLLGILTAVAVPKYFDLQNEARQKAALTAITEAQSRINATFSQKLLEGKIIAIYQQDNSTVNSNAAASAELMQEVLANLGDPFIDNPVEYWRIVNSEALRQSNIFLTSTNLENMTVSAMRVPFMQMQKTANGEMRYFVGMMGVSKLSNGNGAMLIHDNSGKNAGTIWNQYYGGVPTEHGGAANGGTFLVKDLSGVWSEQSTQPVGMSFEEAQKAYTKLLARFPDGYQIPGS